MVDSATTALSQLLVSRATELARAGRFEQAESLLQEATEAAGPSAAGLDLLARIRAQQGRLMAAEQLWTEASRLEPENDAFAAGLRRIAQLRQRGGWLRPLLYLAAALVVAVALLATARSFDRLYDALEASRQAPTEPPPAPTPIVNEAPPPAAPPPAAPSLELDVPGLQLRTENDELVATFESGLFFQGTTFRPEAPAVLAALGEQLEPHIGSVHVVIVGHTNALPMPEDSDWSDNAALGLARAAAAFDQLRQRAHLPAHAFSLRSAVKAGPTRGTWEDGARQQTVELRFSDSRPR